MPSYGGQGHACIEINWSIFQSIPPEVFTKMKVGLTRACKVNTCILKFMELLKAWQIYSCMACTFINIQDSWRVFFALLKMSLGEPRDAGAIARLKNDGLRVFWTH